jgi:hypothetical protein
MAMRLSPEAAVTVQLNFDRFKNNFRHLLTRGGLNRICGLQGFVIIA